MGGAGTRIVNHFLDVDRNLSKGNIPEHQSFSVIFGSVLGIFSTAIND